MDILVENIIWDTDGQRVRGLPDTVRIRNADDDLIEDAELDGDLISSFLSDELGFCVESFTATVVDPE